MDYPLLEKLLRDVEVLSPLVEEEVFCRFICNNTRRNGPDGVN